MYCKQRSYSSYVQKHGFKSRFKISYEVQECLRFKISSEYTDKLKQHFRRNLKAAFQLLNRSNSQQSSYTKNLTPPVKRSSEIITELIVTTNQIAVFYNSNCN